MPPWEQLAGGGQGVGVQFILRDGALQPEFGFLPIADDLDRLPGERIERHHAAMVQHGNVPPGRKIEPLAFGGVSRVVQAGQQQRQTACEQLSIGAEV